MTQVWPAFGVAPVPTLMSMIFKPDGVVMTFWAMAGGAAVKAPAMVTMMAAAIKAPARVKTGIPLSPWD
jgi:hypothetical protein